MTERSAKATVRNPVLALPAAALLMALPPESRQALRSVLIELRDSCRRNADLSWKKGKAPMACYWKAVGVYCNHLSRALK